MRMYGVNGFKIYISGHARLGKIFHALLASRPDFFKRMVPTAFALIVFDIIPCIPRSKSHQDGEGLDINALTIDDHILIKQRGETLIISTVVGELYAIRVVAPNPKSDEQYVRKAFES